MAEVFGMEHSIVNKEVDSSILFGTTPALWGKGELRLTPRKTLPRSACSASQTLRSLRHPVSRTSRIPHLAAPCTPSGTIGQSARACRILVLDGYGRVNKAACRYRASELHKVGVAQNPIGYIDVKIVSRIASPPLRHKVKLQAPL